MQMKRTFFEIDIVSYKRTRFSNSIVARRFNFYDIGAVSRQQSARISAGYIVG